MAEAPKREKAPIVQYTDEELEIINDLTQDFDQIPNTLDSIQDDTDINVAPGEELPSLSNPQDNLDTPTDTPDLGDLDNLDTPTDTPDLGDLDNLDTSTDTPDLGDLDNLDTSTDTPDLGDLDNLDTSTDTPDLGDLDNLDTSTDTPDLGDLDNLDTPTDTPDLGDLDNLDTPTDAPDLGDLDNLDTSTDAPDLGDLDNLDTPTDAPDLGDLDNLDTPTDAPDLGDLDNLDTPTGAPDLGDLDNLDTPTGAAPGLGDLDNLDTPTGAAPDLGDLDNLDTPTDELDANKGNIPSLDDVESNFNLSSEISSDLQGLEEEQYADDEVHILREELKKFPIVLRKVILDGIIEDRLPGHAIKELISLVKNKASFSQIRKFLEQILGIELGEDSEKHFFKPKVILAKEHYTEDKVESKRKQVQVIKFFSILGVISITLLSLIYFFIIKPFRYNSYVDKGKSLILNNTPEPPSKQHIEMAEKNFNKASKIYPQKIKHYLIYGNAYKQVGLYNKAFEKLFGKIQLTSESKTLKYKNKILSPYNKIWTEVEQPPIIKKINHNTIQMYNNTWEVNKAGALLKEYLEKKRYRASTLLELGRFHSNHVNRFKTSYYKNNLLGIEYFNKIQTFETQTPIFQANKYINNSIIETGRIYYHQNDYFKANAYFEKVIANDPKNIKAHDGMLSSLFEIYRLEKDPRFIIEYHNKLKYNLKIEEEMPLHIISKLISFYIDLPKDDELRIQYNINPIDTISSEKISKRTDALLKLLFVSKDKDEYGATQEGRYFAEGFYQRGRYFNHVKNNIRMALTQMEYALKYNPYHFLAINDRGELLLKLNDYDNAIKHFNKSIKLIENPNIIHSLGERPEDTTLLQADLGRLYFNHGKALYLSAIKNLGNFASWSRLSEVGKYSTDYDIGYKAFTSSLDQIDYYFNKAEEIGVENNKLKQELYYYMGWSNYTRHDYKKSIFYWELIDEKVQLENNELALAKSSAFYKLAIDSNNLQNSYLQNSLSYLLLLNEKHDSKLNNIATVSTENKKHITIFNQASIIHNNLGAIYELLNEEESSIQHYWKSINYSNRIDKENEIARYNLKLSFKRKGLSNKEAYPIIMDFIKPQLDYNL